MPVLLPSRGSTQRLEPASRLLDQLQRRPLLHHPPFIHHQDLVAGHDRPKSVRDDEHRSARELFVDDAGYGSVGERVDGPCGFVEDQDAVALQQSPGQHDELFLTGGETGGDNQLIPSPWQFWHSLVPSTLDLIVKVLEYVDVLFHPRRDTRHRRSGTFRRRLRYDGRRADRGGT